MRIRIYNARIITMLNDMITNGEIWIRDSEIEYIGANSNPGNKFDREIDAKGNLLMPGFKNAHAHSPMTFARSLADGLPLNDWLQKKIFPMEAKLTHEHIYYFSKLAYMEYLTSGITAAFDMYYEPEAIIKASEECGFRTVLCGAVNNFKESVEVLEKYYMRYNDRSEMTSYILGFHAEYTSDLNLIQDISKLSNKYSAPVYVHNSETRLEVENCIKKYGKTPTKLFEDLGIYENGGGGFHCVHINDEDIEIFKRKGLYAVINSASNLKLGSGIAPLADLLNKGVKVALGTDGASSNNALDMFREMYLSAVLQNILNDDTGACKASDILKIATVGGAEAMGLNQCNVLDIGKKADIIMIDMNRPNMQPINNIVNNIIYSGSKENVMMTMINGKILYENGEFTTIDKEEIYYNANKLIKTLL